MRNSRLFSSIVAATLGAAATLAPVRAADTAPASSTASRHASPSGIADRLFLSFAQDAAIVPSQWWEGQLEFSDGSTNIPVDSTIARGVVAFQPFRNIEIGGRVGFGSTSASGNRPDGTGATDLDIYAKYFFGNVLDHCDFTAGLLLTVPTGDDTSGLGFNSFAEQIFGGVRYRTERAVIGGHIGLRLNGDGDFQGVSLSGKTSVELAGNVTVPMKHKLSFVGEAKLETERFDNTDSIAEVLGGINWHAFGRGMLRSAIGFGLTDSTPDFTFIASYAYTF